MSDLPTVTDTPTGTPQVALMQARNVPIAWAKRGHLPEASRNDAETQRTSHEKSLEAQKATMLAELDKAHSALVTQITALEMSGSSDEKITSEIADLKNRAQKNRDLRDDIKNPFYGRSIESLKADVSIQTGQGAANAANNAVSAVIYANSGGAMGGAAAIALEQARRETTSFLERTAADYEKRTDFATNLAAKYGIDVSAERKAIDEAKRREAEAKTPEEKLDWRIRGYRAEIGLHDKNLDNPHLTDTERQREEEAKRKALKELEEAEQRRARMQAAQKGTEHSTEHNNAGFNQRQQDSYAAHRREVDKKRYQHLLTDAESIRAEAEDVTQKSEWRKTKTLNAAADAARPIIEASRAMAAEGKRADAKNGINVAQLDYDDPFGTKTAEKDAEKTPVPTRLAVADEKDGHQAVAAPPATPAATKTVAEVSSATKSRSV